MSNVCSFEFHVKTIKGYCILMSSCLPSSGGADTDTLLARDEVIQHPLHGATRDSVLLF